MALTLSQPKDVTKVLVREPSVFGHLPAYNQSMERKIFWMVFTALGLLADFLLPLWWALAATVPAVFVAWWVAYRSEWF